MGEIVILHRPDARPASAAVHDALSSLPEALLRIVANAEELVATLEQSLARIRLVIEEIPDAETKRRLTEDHTVLTAALRDAKSRLAAMAAEMLAGP